MGDLEPRRPGALAVPGGQITPEMAVAIAERMLAQGKTFQRVVPHSDAARAYVYGGEWVADCPAGCKNTELVTGKDPRMRGRAGSRGEPYTWFSCSYCGHRAPISWPAQTEEILQVLDRRPIPHTRNWYPTGHPTAVLAGIPDGQSVAELIGENVEHGLVG